MSGELVEAVEAALVPSSDVEELKPENRPCLHPGCDRAATRSDERCARHSGFRLTKAQIQRRVGDLVARDANFYRKQHRIATERAALKGDAEPAQWGLIHSGAVKPVEKQGAASGGVIVQVGVVLPGLKEGV